MYNYDRKLVITILDNISWAIRQITYRFNKIETPDDFLDDEDGLAILDSICMQLINIGEALKNIDKITDKQLLTTYPEIDWKKVMGMRDIITHHYFDVDAETVYTVCDIHLSNLDEVINRIIKDIS
jgi:uncharacterized protein with HEPN domain